MNIKFHSGQESGTVTGNFDPSISFKFHNDADRGVQQVIAFDTLGTETPPIDFGGMTERFAIIEAANAILRKRGKPAN